MSDFNLPANIEEVSEQELLDLTGFSRPMQVDLPSLRVNYNDEDDAGNEIKRGHWCIYTPDGTVYAKEVTFRPLVTTFQYSHYDKSTNSFVSKSIHFQDWKTEIIDSAGGIKCGKVSKKQFEELTDAEKAAQKEIKCSKALYGMVSMKGQTATGDVQKLESYPCVYYAKGSSFMPMSDFLENLSKQKVSAFKTNISLKLKRERNDGVFYWVVQPTVASNVDLDSEDMALIRKFGEMIASENEGVVKDWTKEQSRKNDKTMVDIGSSSGEIIPPGELDDEIPF